MKISGNTDEPFKPQVLRETKPEKERYCASPVCHDGLIYAIDQKQMFCVINAASGEIIYNKKLAMEGTLFPSIILAGKICIFQMMTEPPLE